jgi:hypothetical protein
MLGERYKASWIPSPLENRSPSEPAAPISKAMKEGREPLRTFGDLKQFLDSRDGQGGAADEAPAE